MGRTNDTIRRGTPNFSIFSSASGSAASDEAVVKARSQGSLVQCQNLRKLILAIIATGTNATSTNTSNATYNVNTSLPRLNRTPSPFFPMVTPSAAAMPIGANFMTRPVNLNITCARASQTSSMTSFGRPFTWVSAIANNAEKKTIWRVSFLAMASTILAGTVCSSTPANVV